MKFVTKSQLQDVVEYMGENIHVPQLVQHFDSDCIYSTNERVVGCWIDGKPLYKKTINFGAGPNNAAKQFTHGISIDNVVDAWGIGVSGVNRSPIPYISKDLGIIAALNVRTTTIDIATNVDLSSYTIYVTLYYTKTTDAVNSFNLANENDYSTTEKVVGKWIDGKTIYKKTLTGLTLGNSSTTIHDIGSTVDTLIKYEGVYSKLYPIVYPDTTTANNTYAATLYIDSSDKSKLKVSVRGNWSADTTTITLYYTKAE